MRVMIAYPPLEGKGSPMLTQNRQFQWFSEPSYLYPCVPASAATYLKSLGHEVCWVDAIAEHKDWSRFEKLVRDFQPELIAMETKTPVVRQHWAITDRLKKIVPGVKVVLFGDHITGNGEETILMSSVDYSMMGGDYDFSLKTLVEHIEDGKELGAGFWYRDDKGDAVTTGPFANTDGSLEDLPWIDRDLTNAHLYFEKWKKHLPFMWTMAGRDCPYGKCTFCSWTVTYPKFRTVSPERLAAEMEFLVKRYGTKNIFDDTGALPTGNWLTRLCNEMIARKIPESAVTDCNFRFDYITSKNAPLMKKANFRKLLIGVESANERTIDILDKGITREQVIEGATLAAENGLEVHLTLMIGYPWETREDAYETFNLAKDLLNRGLAHHLQATVVMPYPGTPLFDLCKKYGWVRFDEKAYERYDMTEPACVLTDMKQEEVVRLAGQFYKLFLHPSFLKRQIMNVRRPEDLDYMFRGSKAIYGHIKDFSQIRAWGQGAEV
jgi:anaerobic magnesium-protoporphyrin IX monomethyl ester cyclase